MAKANKAAALAISGNIYGPAKGVAKVFATLGVSLLPNALLLSACTHPNPKKAASLYLTDVLLQPHNLIAIREAANGWGEEEDQAIADGYTHVVFYTKGEIGEQATPIDENITTITGIVADDSILAGGLLVSTADAEGTPYGDYVISGSAAALWIEGEGVGSLEGTEVDLGGGAEPEPEPEPVAAKGGKGAKGAKGAAAAPEPEAPAAKGGKGAKGAKAAAEPEAPAAGGKGGKGGKGGPARAAAADDTGW